MTADLDTRLADAVERDTLAPVIDEELHVAVDHLVAASEGTIRAILFFGSRMSGAGANTHSAHDLFVIVDDYRRYYDAMVSAGLSREGARFLSTLNRLLPPNQLSYRLPEGRPFHGKCAVISLHHFLREASEARRDHFCQGRLFQPVSLLHACDDRTRDLILRALADVRRQTIEWAAPYLPSTFDVEGYCLRCLQVSLAGELRPESSSRALRLAEAQRTRQHPVYSTLLELLGSEGLLARVGEDRWRLARAPSPLARLRWRGYFASSLVRATLRWVKHILTFEGWLEYLVRKVERHSGQRIELTERERRHPLVFLWPRFLRHMRGKDKGEDTK